MTPDARAGAAATAAASRSVLLTGDIERDQELALVAASMLRSDVLMIPQDGSTISL